MIHNSKWFFLNTDSWTTIQYESRIGFVRHRSNLFGVRICDHDTIQTHGFMKKIHVFTNLLYDSRTLNVDTFSNLNRCYSFLVYSSWNLNITHLKKKSKKGWEDLCSSHHTKFRIATNPSKSRFLSLSLSLFKSRFDSIQIHGFAIPIYRYMIPLYDSRNLTIYKPYHLQTLPFTNLTIYKPYHLQTLPFTNLTINKPYHLPVLVRSRDHWKFTIVNFIFTISVLESTVDPD